MSRTSWFAGGALACWITAAGVSVSIAAPPAPPPVPPPPANQVAPPADRPAPPADARPAQTLRAKDVLGSKVSLKGGLAIGTVDDIIFDDGGDIDYLVVLNEGKDVLVPVGRRQARLQQSGGDGGRDAGAVEDDPHLRADGAAGRRLRSRAFQTKIYGYYNLKPRPDRRDRAGATGRDCVRRRGGRVSCSGEARPPFPLVPAEMSGDR